MNLTDQNFDIKSTWTKCLADIESVVGAANFATWFKNTIIVKEDSGTVIVGVPNEFVKDWLFNKYHKLILKTLRDISDSIKNVEYTIAKYEQKVEQPLPPKQGTAPSELPLRDLYINKDDNLNPRYIFETFIVGPFNELAYAAAQAIINRPGGIYNPFFIYGNTGLGKTHLIQGIGNMIKEKYPEKKVYYTNLEKFSIDYINSLSTKQTNNFKEKYRKYDVLIMDDIQFISNREKTQEELFHLFNTLYENNKQIIFSSDKHPNHIIGLEDRLKTRFGAGMIVDISEPDYESRYAIFKSKFKEADVAFSDESLQFLSLNIEGSIRELEGLVNTIICQAQLKNRELSIQELKVLIKNNIKPKKTVSVEDVVKIVANFYNIEEQFVYEKTRRKEIVKARQVIMYLLREDFNVSYPLIGQKLGGKDHSTVMHSCDKIKNDLTNDGILMQELDQLRILFK